MKAIVGTSTAWAAALTLACPAPCGAAGLNRANFAAYGAVIADLLEQSTLTVTSMSASALEQVPGPRRAVLATGPRAQRSQMSCPGGGRVRSTYVDSDGSDDLSAGDRFVTIYEQCVANGQRIDGRYEFTIESHRHEGHDGITDVRFQFRRLGHAGMRWTGVADATLRTDLLRGTERYVIRYRDLAVSTRAHAMRWRFTLDFVRPPFGGQVASLEGDLVIDHTPLALSQPDPFVFTRLKSADAGRVSARDAIGATLDVTADHGRYTYRYCPAMRSAIPIGSAECLEAQSHPASDAGQDDPGDDTPR